MGKLRGSVLFLGLLLFATAAHADATVDALLVPTPGGGWREVSTSDATTGPAEAPVVVRPGAHLADGEILRTGTARVRLVVRGAERVIVDAGSEVVIGDRTVLQRIGDAFYRVRAAFSVRYERIEAAVDGTRYQVGPGGVRVHGGVVQVRFDGGSPTPVRAGEAVEALTEGLDAVRALSPTERAQGRTLTRQLGPPRFAFAVEGGGGFFGEGAGSVRLGARLGLTRVVELTTEAGMSFDDTAFHLPLAVGLGGRWRGLRAGAALDLRVGRFADCDTPETTRVFPGGHAFVGLTVPIANGVGFTATARGGYAHRPFAEGSAGLTFGW